MLESVAALIKYHHFHKCIEETVYFLQVQGNMGLAMKLQEFQKTAPKAKL
jgi:hypothetical protein